VFIKQFQLFASPTFSTQDDAVGWRSAFSFPFLFFPYPLSSFCFFLFSRPFHVLNALSGVSSSAKILNWKIWNPALLQVSLLRYHINLPTRLLMIMT